MIGIPQPYLTPDRPGIGGQLKVKVEDFQVREIPLYHPADHGEHTFFELEKTDLSTLEALARLANHLSLSTRDFGFAGLKDRKGITCQRFSVRLVSPEKVLAIQLSQMKVLWARLHTNKLRVGHLRGNHFRVRIREVEAAPRKIENVVNDVERLGLANFFGPQRFGNRGDSFRIGRALLTRKPEQAFQRILGCPESTEKIPASWRPGRVIWLATLPAPCRSFRGATGRNVAS